MRHKIAKYTMNNIPTIVLSLALAFTSYLSFKRPRDVAEDLMMEKQDSILSINHEKGSGTVFIIITKSGKKVGITNNHVCGQFNKFVLVSRDGSTQYPSRLLGHYPLHDLCMVSVPQNLPALKIADKSYIDEPVYSAGFAGMPAMSSTHGYLRVVSNIHDENFQVPLDVCPGKVKEVKKKNKNGEIVSKRVCVFDALGAFTTMPVTFGASGSPMMNVNGEVIGVVMALQGTLSHCIAVPLSVLKDFLSMY